MGHPYNLYHEPLTPFVASFVGQGYFIRGQLLSPDTVQTELGVIRGNRAYSLPSGSAVDVLLRPDDLVHAPQGELKARIVGKTFLGAATLYRLQLPTGTQLESIFPAMPTTSRAMTSVSASPPTTWWCSPPGAASPRTSLPSRPDTSAPFGRRRLSLSTA